MVRFCSSMRASCSATSFSRAAAASSSAETLYVPGFVGQMYTDVMKNQDYQEVYRFRAVYQHSSAEEGRVVDQRPAQGSVIQEGDTIELIVSQGNVKGSHGWKRCQWLRDQY